ncbi:hypothetical protein [Micavibrio aeruginosavorus]|uniref:Uncharacterized protein n=1 Tax=Micavibrio aeruginosavorus EPB TaxID=349215 RepID=M4VIL5_9BACT|nr:hypothetical protein [Micavibrio aeruginosavorus]AGH99028.1 hypothetical protein A11S_2232 [Micavibrio aeruginosavorus EPB]
MKTYQTERNVPSILVTVGLIKAIEKETLLCTTQLTKEWSPEEKAELRDGLSISITDFFGTETLKSVADFKWDKFSDTTAKIEINLKYTNVRTNQECLFLTELNREKLKSRIFVEIKDSEPRIIAEHFIAEIGRTLESKKTWNGLLHPNEKAESFVSLFVLGTLLFGVLYENGDESKNSIYKAAMLTASAVSFSYLQFGSKLKPYIYFASNKAERYEKISNWVIGVAITAIIIPVAMNLITSHWK